MRIAFFLICSLCLILQDRKANTDQVNIDFKSCNTVIHGFLQTPKQVRSDKIAIFVLPCLTKKYIIQSKKDSSQFAALLKEKLLQKGISVLSFSAREDSVQYNLSSLYTKADDLLSVINYLKSSKELNFKEFILVGQSEGGASCIVASSKFTEINSLVLLSTPLLSGRELQEYQYANNDTLVTETYGSDSNFYKYTYLVSPIKRKTYEYNINGFRSFRKDLFAPLDSILYSFESYDTIAKHINNFIQNKWNKEDITAKNIFKTYENYRRTYYKVQIYTTPQQIALAKWNPSSYYLKVPCRVLAVFGSNDKIVDYKLSIENFNSTLHKNNNSKSILLEGYNHYLENIKNKSNESIFPADSVIKQIVQWILNP